MPNRKSYRSRRSCRKRTRKATGGKRRNAYRKRTRRGGDPPSLIRQNAYSYNPATVPTPANSTRSKATAANLEKVKRNAAFTGTTI